MPNQVIFALSEDLSALCCIHEVLSQQGLQPWPRPSSMKSPDGFKHLPFTTEASALWDLQICRNVSVPFPKFVPRYNPVLEVYRQFIWLYGLICALTCTVNYGPYIDRRLPFQIKQINLCSTPIKLQKLRMMNPENSFEFRSKGCEYSCICIV